MSLLLWFNNNVIVLNPDKCSFMLLGIGDELQVNDHRSKRGSPPFFLSEPILHLAYCTKNEVLQFAVSCGFGHIY